MIIGQQRGQLQGKLKHCCTIWPRSLVPFFVVSYYIKLVKTSWDIQYDTARFNDIILGTPRSLSSSFSYPVNQQVIGMHITCLPCVFVSVFSSYAFWIRSLQRKNLVFVYLRLRVDPVLCDDAPSLAVQTLQLLLQCHDLECKFYPGFGRI